jgi:hypothetical protein
MRQQLPTASFPKRETVEPCLTAVLTDKVDPSIMKSQTEILPPARDTLLIDMALPMHTVSNTDKGEAPRILAQTDRELPARARPRMLRMEP